MLSGGDMNSGLIYRTLSLGLLIPFGAGLTPGQTSRPDGTVRGGTLPATWVTGGPRCIEVPDWQIHQYNEDLYIIRESGCVDYEKPFLYLFFGKDRALLEDTGSGTAETARAVNGVISKWLLHNKRASIPLVVMHSHSHDDHVAGDKQFQAMKGVTMVPLTVSGTASFFGVRKWPDDTGQIDLGNRVIDMIPIPGHDTLSVALYDRQTGILFTGDSLYPGRVFVRDFDAFVKSNQRLVDFTRGKIVMHILGCHVEQSTTPYVDYPVGTAYQPSEAPLAFSRAHLLEMNDALREMKGSRERVLLRDFTIWPIDDQHPFPKAVSPGAP
jgi:hydroxyacylglutathione hydrolase